MAGNTISITITKRDKTCGYCYMSEYREDFDNREFYQIRNANRDINTFVISICEVCARELYQTLGETVKPE